MAAAGALFFVADFTSLVQSFVRRFALQITLQQDRLVSNTTGNSPLHVVVSTSYAVNTIVALASWMQQK